MFFISHRGNINGPEPKNENKIEYINEAMQKLIYGLKKKIFILAMTAQKQKLIQNFYKIKGYGFIVKIQIRFMNLANTILTFFGMRKIKLL